MLRTRLFSVTLVGSVLGTAVAACGGHSPFELKKSNGRTGPSTSGTPETGDAAAAATSTFNFTASYQPRPLDLLIIRDSPSRYNPIADRVTGAAPLLAARLWNLAAGLGSVHVGVFDQYYAPKNNPTDPPPPTNGAPLTVGTDPAGVLPAEAMSATDFTAVLEARLQAAGTRGGDARPASVFMAALAESAQPGGGSVSGLFRDNAYWAVLYITATANPDDPYDADDVALAVKAHTSGFSVSALTLEKTDCTYAGTTTPQETNPNKTPQRNLELKMQELTGGVAGSVCAETYSIFMDDFATKGTGTQYFPVRLPVALKAGTITVTSQGGVPIKDFSYTPGSTTLEVSTLIPSGQSFSVQAVPDGPVPNAVVSTDPGDPSVPQAGQATLSPAEAAFLQSVNPVLQKDCASCHNGRPFDTSAGYASAMTNKSEIARRIQLPTTDPQRMPQSGTLSAADQAAILAWATK